MPSLNDWAGGDKEPEDRDSVIRGLLRNLPSPGEPFDMLLQWTMKTRHERVLQIAAEVQTEKDDSDRHGQEKFDSSSEMDGF